MILSTISMRIFGKETDWRLLFIHISKDILLGRKSNFVRESVVQCIYSKEDTKGTLYHHALLPGDKKIVLDDAICHCFFGKWS